MTTTTHAGRFWLRHAELVAQAVERLGRTLAASRGEEHGQRRLAQTAGSLAAHGIGVSIRRTTQRDWWAKEMLTLRVTLRSSGEGQRAHELTLHWKEEQTKAAMEWGSEPQRGREPDGADEQWCDPTGIRPNVWLGSDSTPGAQALSTEQAHARLNGLREIADLLRPIGKPEAALGNQLRLHEIETVSETMAEALRALGAWPIQNGICDLGERVAKTGWEVGLEYGGDDRLERIDISCAARGGAWPDAVGRADGPDSERDPARTTVGVRLSPEPIELTTGGHAETCLGYLGERQDSAGNRLMARKTLAVIASHPEARTRGAALAAMTQNADHRSGMQIHGGPATQTTRTPRPHERGDR